MPPIIEREFRVALRRHAAGKSRFKIAAVATCVMAVFMVFGENGSSLYWLFFYAGLYLAVMPPLQISSALFTGAPSASAVHGVGNNKDSLSFVWGSNCTS